MLLLASTGALGVQILDLRVSICACALYGALKERALRVGLKIEHRERA